MELYHTEGRVTEQAQHHVHHGIRHSRHSRMSGTTRVHPMPVSLMIRIASDGLGKGRGVWLHKAILRLAQSGISRIEQIRVTNVLRMWLVHRCFPPQYCLLVNTPPLGPLVRHLDVAA